MNEDGITNSCSSTMTDINKNNNHFKIQTKLTDEFDLDNDDSQELEPYKPLKKKIKHNTFPNLNAINPVIENESAAEWDQCVLSNENNENNENIQKATETECAPCENSNDHLTPSFEQDLSLSCDSFNAFKKLDSIICSSSKIENKEDPFDLLSDEEKEKNVAYRPLKRKTSCASFASLGKTVDLNERSDSSESTAAKTECSNNSNDSVDTKDQFAVKPRVVYIYSDELKEKTNTMNKIENRAELTHCLIRCYGLLKYIQVKEPRPATEAEIRDFHCPQYIACLKKCGSFVDADDIPDTLNDEAEGYGLSYDCPQQAGIFETAALISGASITAAEALIAGTADIAVNWCGGWHHAKRDSASGFCYINDIVLAILKLKEKYDRVLYVDIDLHHGDGVEEAFETTPKVMTVSFHKYDTGFFPGSGSISDVGSGKGKFYSVNVPLKDGIKDAEFFAVFTRVMRQVKVSFAPQALVLQCGADGLAQDPMSAFNLTHVGLARCVCYCLAWRLPTLMLGGGGYHFANTAKTWTFLTAVAAGKKLPIDIPEHDHLLEYGPGYELTTSVGNRKDCNTPQYLAQVVTTIAKNLSNIKESENAKTTQPVISLTSQI